MSFVSDFTALFKYTTNSYKYLFLKSVLSRVNKGEHVLSIDDLVLDILVFAWYPNQFFKLSFGLQDKIAALFDFHQFQFADSAAITSPDFNSRLRKAIANEINQQDLTKELARYVQYRLLTPFFAEELRGQPDGFKNRLIKEAAVVNYDSRRPLYRINNNSNDMEIHPAWTKFIQSYSPLLFQFLESKWVEFLQKKNPNIPAIIYKTSPPAARASLSRQRSYWLQVINEIPETTCIYSNARINAKSISLDHFLPWSFVCNDGLWNLIPTIQSVNSSKGNRLPDLDKYLGRFINTQQIAVDFHSKNNSSWQKIAQDLGSDLNISPEIITTNNNSFADKLAERITTQHNVAKELGFESWVYYQ